jgi:beta-xylosidase
MSERPSGYRNPVIPGFHPDPSVCRVGDAYYLATSSFTYFPGVPIFRSTDLVTWTQIGNALERTSQLDLRGTETYASAGVFAPTLRHHAGRFWMITTVLVRGLETFFVTAEDPSGPWSEPVRVAVPGIDPDLVWDDEGRCFVHSSALSIRRCLVDDRTGEVLGKPVRTWSGIGLQYPEAPHVFRRESFWYLLIAEGGTERGHAVSIARGPAPVGPWEGCPANPILSHRSTDRPIQSTGHADLVEAPDGSWWMVLLATRPRGVTPNYHVLGRETFLVPIDWKDGWPVPRDLALDMPFAPPGPASGRPTPERDDFDGAALGPEWISVRGPLGDVASLGARRGWLTLRGRAAGLDDPWPVFVGRRQQHLHSRARARVDAGSAEAGLAVRMDERHHYAVALADGEVIVRATIGPLASIVARAAAPRGAVVLRMETHDPEPRLGPAPDRVHLGFERGDGGFEVLADLDGRYVSTEVAGGFIGRVVGLYARGGTAAFDWFELAKRDAAAG